MGVLRSVAGTDPAANVEISETVAAGKFWRLESITFALVTDASAANRLVEIVIDDGTNVLARIPAPAVQAASLTRTYTFARGGYDRDSSTNSLTQLAGLPDMVLGPAYRVRTVTTNRQATDNYGAPQLLVMEYDDEPTG